jgi:putative endonuclease
MELILENRNDLCLSKKREMAVVYILYSEKFDKFYTGSCLDFEDRLLQHLNKFYRKSFTTLANDWTTFLVIENLSYLQARKIESHIKSMKSKKYIKNLKQYPEMQEKLILRFSD